ncbi:MAG: RNA polymerase sigma factor [Bacteroidota bacterium]|jgi:RNA polymerase sigma factor (sigma-70 family)
MFLFRKKKYSELADEALLLEYRKTKNMRVIEELFNRYARKMLGVCIFYLEDKEAAKDAVMQIFNKLINELIVREPNNFKGWLSFVVRNHCISEIRKTKSLKKRHEDFYEFEYTAPDELIEGKISSVTDDVMLAHVKDGLNTLKDGQRICVELFFLNEKSYLEISKLTGFQIKKVKSYIQNGKRNLKLFLSEKIKNSRPAA